MKVQHLNINFEPLCGCMCVCIYLTYSMTFAATRFLKFFIGNNCVRVNLLQGQQNKHVISF